MFVLYKMIIANVYSKIILYKKIILLLLAYVISYDIYMYWLRFGNSLLTLLSNLYTLIYLFTIRV